MREDLLNDWRLQNRRDDLQLAAAVRAVRKVEIKTLVSAKTNLLASYVAAKDAFEQAHPTGPGRHAPLASPAAGCAAEADMGGSVVAQPAHAASPTLCKRRCQHCMKPDQMQNAVAV